jgi:hypothetical protein
LKSQLWLPHQVALEYHDRVEVIIGNAVRGIPDALARQFKVLRSDHSAASDNKDLQDKISNYRVVDEDSTKVLLEAASTLQKHRLSAEKAVTDVMKKWKGSYIVRCETTKERIADLFEKSVGGPYEPSQLVKLIEEARVRFLQNVPPGYEDRDKTENPYGDALIWFQMLDHARETRRPIVFVTGDSAKGDWFYSGFDGKTLAPRAELVEEMKNKASVDFHMYRDIQFLKFAAAAVDSEVNQDSVKEMEGLAKSKAEAQYSELLHRLDLKFQSMGYGALSPERLESILLNNPFIFSTLNRTRADIWAQSASGGLPSFGNSPNPLYDMYLKSQSSFPSIADYKLTAGEDLKLTAGGDLILTGGEDLDLTDSKQSGPHENSTKSSPKFDQTSSGKKSGEDKKAKEP